MIDQVEITLYGTTWCGDCRRTRNFLDRNQIPYRWIDIDKDSEAGKLVERINNGYRSVPTLIFPDNSHLTEPTELQLAEKLGLSDTIQHKS
jgi:mycoredoxin